MFNLLHLTPKSSSGRIYIVHCDTDPEAGRKCSGNSLCSYEGNPYNESNLFSCDGWRSCSNQDNAKFQILNYNPPTISSLYIDAKGNDDSVKGETRISGLRSDDSLNITTSGKNNYNYLLIAPRINNGSNPDTANIALTGVIFAGQTKPSSLSNALNQVSSNNGFIALYSNQNLAANQNPLGIAITQGYYYFYVKNQNGQYGWQSKSQDRFYPSDTIAIGKDYGLTIGGVGPKSYCGLPFIQDDSTTPELNPCFRVYIFKKQTNSTIKTWGTYSYVYDYFNNQEIISNNQNPLPIQ